MRSQTHPVEDEHIETAIEESGGDLSFDEVDGVLQDLQEYIELDVGEEIGWIDRNYGEAPEYGAGYATTYDHVLFTCWSPNFSLALERTLGLSSDDDEDIIKAVGIAHCEQFDDLVNRRDVKLNGSTKKPRAEYGSLVVKKPSPFIWGENVYLRTINRLVDAGASPAQVLDYLMTNRGIKEVDLDSEEIDDRSSVSEWADRRDRSPQAIYQNIRGAAQALDEYNSEKKRKAVEREQERYK